MAALVDTNILVYRFDARFPKKQQIATRLLRDGIRRGSLRLAHQTIVEFVAVGCRLAEKGLIRWDPAEVRREAEELLATFEVYYPNEAVLRTALRGAAAYRLSWFDAHVWAFAEHYGLRELYSEDFEHDRLYGSVRTINPFAGIG